MKIIKSILYYFKFPYRTKGPNGDVRWSIIGDGVIHVDTKTWFTSGCVEEFYKKYNKQ